MASGLYLIILLLCNFQCEGSVCVKNESLIQIAFSNEPVITHCMATMACKPEYKDFEININYYRIDPEGNEIVVLNKSETLSGCQANQTQRRNCELRIEPIEHASVTGTYYCEVKWKTSTVRGNGTYILFRDKGYIEPSDTLQRCLIAIVNILAILSIVGTALLLWKRKILWPWKSHVKKCSAQSPVPQQASSHLELPEPTYTDLEPHQSEIYVTLERNTNRLCHKKKPVAKISQQETHGEIQDVYENNVTELYENI